jgi:hypothetical protein
MFSVVFIFSKSYQIGFVQTQLAPLHHASTLPNLVSKTLKSEGKVETLPSLLSVLIAKCRLVEA